MAAIFGLGFFDLEPLLAVLFVRRPLIVAAAAAAVEVVVRPFDDAFSVQIDGTASVSNLKSLRLGLAKCWSTAANASSPLVFEALVLRLDFARAARVRRPA